VGKPTIKEIEEYMAGYNMGSPVLPDTIPSANAKQVSGKHYKEKIIQPWDYIYANNLGYFEGNCVKYVSRWRDKGGIADLQKAIHYLEKLIELEKNKQP
jgi:hypothetical protein